MDLDATGLIAAINNLAYRVRSIYNIRCVFSTDPQLENMGNGMTSLHLYYIAHEAINNAVKHSAADTITISLLIDNGNLVLSVADNGKGIEKKERKRDSDNDGRKGGMGLRIMQHRAEMIRATLEVGGCKPSGTCLRCSVPLVYMSNWQDKDEL